MEHISNYFFQAAGDKTTYLKERVKLLTIQQLIHMCVFVFV
jgi:hypothetical protein